MRMRYVIEAGRKVSPLVNMGLSCLKDKIAGVEQLINDLSVVKSEDGREAMVRQCLKSVLDLAECVSSVETSWAEFDRVLCDYKYKFRKGKRELMADMPGQSKLFDDKTGEPSAEFILINDLPF